MNDFLCWLYDHYIHPHILAQPMDDGDTFRCSLLDGSVTPDQRRDVEAVRQGRPGLEVLPVQLQEGPQSGAGPQA